MAGQGRGRCRATRVNAFFTRKYNAIGPRWSARAARGPLSPDPYPPRDPSEKHRAAMVHDPERRSKRSAVGKWPSRPIMVNSRSLHGPFVDVCFFCSGKRGSQHDCWCNGGSDGFMTGQERVLGSGIRRQNGGAGMSARYIRTLVYMCICKPHVSPVGNGPLT